MTVAALTPSVSYTENGVSLNFAVPFRYLDPTHLVVKRTSAAGVQTTLANGTDWSATAGTTDAGGTLTLAASVAGSTLTIVRVTPRSQTTDYVANDRFPAETHEATVDRAMLIDQEQDVDLARAFRMPSGEAGLLVPAVPQRNGKYLGFDAATGAATLLDGSGTTTDGALVAYTRAAAGALTRSVKGLFDEVVRLTDFAGCDITGTTSSVAALNAAAAVSNNIELPAGYTRLSSLPTIPAGSFRLKGKGKGVSFVVIDHPALAGCLNINAASVNDFIEMKDFTLVAACPNNRCWIGPWISFPTAASYPYRQVEIDIAWKSDLGSTSPSWPGTWGRALRLTNVWYPLIKGEGSSAPVAGETVNTGFLEVTGGSYAMIGATINVNWYYGGDFIRGSAYFETIFLDRCEAVGVTRGIYVPSTTPVGGAGAQYRAASIWANNSHIAAHNACMDLDNVFDVQSAGFNMQRWAAPSAPNWTAYNLNNCQAPKFIGGTIAGNDGSGGVTTKGINATGANSAHGIIAGVAFLNCDTLFTLDASTSHWTVRINVATGSPEAWTVLGSNHDVEWFNSAGHVQRLVNSISTSGMFLTQAGEIGKVSATGITYTATEFLNDCIFRSGAAGAVSDTTPTAAQLIAAMGAPLVNTGKRISLNNQNGGLLTLIAGAGVTLVSTTTVGNGQCRDFMLRVTSVTPGAEAVRLIGLQTGAV